ncbi:MAG TPA: NUDIX domain-containing protein [Gemmatimonadaceae bacterium]|nr:NUDIX domain-containing protein [Gemmatimonadaceae bacterium]
MATSHPPIVRQVSAGGVAYRRAAHDAQPEVALVRVGAKNRWQLPKGIVDAGESPEVTAVREVREEAGIDARLIAPLDVIEYWYVGNDPDGRRVRFHKFVHFYLLEYQAGDVDDHDYEVEESRWVELSAAEAMLAFSSEKKIMEKAQALLTNQRLGTLS